MARRRRAAPAPKRRNGILALILGPKSQLVGLVTAIGFTFGRGEVKDGAADRKAAALALDASRRIHAIEEHGSEQARENRVLIDSIFREIAVIKRTRVTVARPTVTAKEDSAEVKSGGAWKRVTGVFSALGGLFRGKGGAT